MADEHIQIRMGVDQSGVQKGLRSVQSDVRQFVGKTRKDFQEVSKSFYQSFREANRSLSQAVGLGIASLARRAVEDVWDLMTKRAAEFVYRNADRAAVGRTLEQNRQYWKAERQAQLDAWKKEAEVTRDNAKREEIRLNLIRERHRIEEETALKPGDELGFLQMKIRHLKEDIALSRERMIIRRATNAEDASLITLNNEKESLFIAQTELELKKAELLLPKKPPVAPVPVILSPMHQQMQAQQAALRQQMVERFGDPQLLGYRDPNKARLDQAQAVLAEAMAKIITPEGVLVTPGG